MIVTLKILNFIKRVKKLSSITSEQQTRVKLFYSSYSLLLNPPEENGPSIGKSGESNQLNISWYWIKCKTHQKRIVLASTLRPAQWAGWAFHSRWNAKDSWVSLLDAANRNPNALRLQSEQLAREKRQAVGKVWNRKNLFTNFYIIKLHMVMKNTRTRNKLVVMKKKLKAPRLTASSHTLNRSTIQNSLKAPWKTQDQQDQSSWWW